MESVIAAVCTLLVVEPYGSLKLRSCHVKALSDWYTMLYNPSPDYTSTLHCTQEAVYPLYVLVKYMYRPYTVDLVIFKNLAKIIIIIALVKKNVNSQNLNFVKSPKIRNSRN